MIFFFFLLPPTTHFYNISFVKWFDLSVRRFLAFIEPACRQQAETRNLGNG